MLDLRAGENTAALMIALAYVKLSLFPSFGAKHLTPRSLSARNIGSLVCVEGIVTKCKFFIFA